MEEDGLLGLLPLPVRTLLVDNDRAELAYQLGLCDCCLHPVAECDCEWEISMELTAQWQAESQEEDGFPGELHVHFVAAD